MVWDFRTEPEFQGQLDWIRDVVVNEIEPLDLVAPEMSVEAWARAERIIQTIQRTRGAAMLGVAKGAPQNVGSQRLLAAAARGKVLDKRLWTEVAAATGARGNTTALVGTPAQVAEALLDYYDIGVTTFLIRGFDPLEDAGEAVLALGRGCERFQESRIDLLRQHAAQPRPHRALEIRFETFDELLPLLLRRRQLPASWTLFSGLYLLPSLGLGVVGLGRYTNECFPPFVAAGELLERTRATTRRLLFLIAVGLQAAGAWWVLGQAHVP